jgi:hypothetical protein
VRSAIAIGMATLLLAAVGCSRTPDDQRIRAAITSMQKAIEEKRPRDFMEYVAADFTGNDGSVDREGLANLLRVEALRNEIIGVVVGPADVELAGDRAVVRLTATFTGGSGGLRGLLPERASIYAIVSGWKRDGKAWRCYNATWSSDTP